MSDRPPRLRLPFAAVPLRALVLLSGLVVAMVAAPIACGSPYEAFPPDQVCRDVGYAISARAFECTGDTQLAEARYDRFSKQYRCLVTSVDGSPIDVYYHCPAQITALSCDQVVAYGDDLSKYVQLSPTCLLSAWSVDINSIGTDRIVLRSTSPDI